MSDIRFNRWLHQSGTGGVYQDSTGNIGIGTSVPTSALDVQGGNLKIGSNTLSSSGVSTFSNISVTGGSITGLSTIGVTTVTATSLSVNTIGVTTVTATSLSVNGNNYPSSGPLSSRNRWINGDMVIDQRRDGISQASAQNGDYVVDRLRFEGVNSKCTIGQNLNSVTPPVGFKKYAGVQVTTAHSLGASEHFNISRWIEGYNVADFELGTANAKKFTVSFWVRSSVTGTYGLSFLGYDGLSIFRHYVREYTINSSNTWEYKTLTIQGDTSTAITWNTINGAGLFLEWNLGAGTSLQTTADTWSTGLYRSTSNQTNLFATNGATFYLTGVQVEVGTVATPFEHRNYSDELMRCKRYYEALGYGTGRTSGASTADILFHCDVPKRASPSSSNVFLGNSGTLAQFGRSAFKITAVTGVFTVSPRYMGITLTTLDTGMTAGQFAATISGESTIQADAEI